MRPATIDRQAEIAVDGVTGTRRRGGGEVEIWLPRLHRAPTGISSDHSPEWIDTYR